jgi:GNAT superfamily N-acetyltransferase
MTVETEWRSKVVCRQADAGELHRLEPLWRALYRHQAEHGMLLSLPENAYEGWLKSLIPLLGRFAMVVVAEVDGEIVGFVAGRLRTLPPYFGSATVGNISEVYVTDSCRGLGVGRELLALALDWFRAAQIQRVELQVVSGNPRGINFYRTLGWREELVQMVWDTSS